VGHAGGSRRAPLLRLRPLVRRGSVRGRGGGGGHVVTERTSWRGWWWRGRRWQGTYGAFISHFQQLQTGGGLAALRQECPTLVSLEEALPMRGAPLF
jgi:hypothetical protein